MGALTLKIFPFELRSWDIEKFWSFDLTDGFGSNTKIYTNKNLIIQIEPSYNNYSFITLLNDKGRQYFDSILKTWSEQKKITLTKEYWSKFFYAIIITIYVFDHCWTHKDTKCFFTFVYNYSSLEILSMLIKISQNYSCVILRSIEQSKENIDLEWNFQLNNIMDRTQLNSSTICLLITTNPRYEGYCLNLRFRQRFLKGNFKCLIIGSLIDLTFPISFLGSNLNTVKTLAKGGNLKCQDLKFSKNPLLVCSNGFLRRNDSQNIINTFKTLSYSSIFNGIWTGLNKLNSSLSDVGTSILTQIPPLRLKDLNNFSSLYFLNAIVRNISNLKKITELKLLRSLVKNNRQFIANKLLIDQNHKVNRNKTALIHVLKKYTYIPQNTFYENEHTFINVEGFIKRTAKLVKGQSTKNNWQTLRKLIQQYKNRLTSLTLKNNQIIFFNSKKLYTFKQFLNFQCFAIQSLTHLNSNLTIRNKALMLNFLEFKIGLKKSFKTRIKLELDDFFIEGKDIYTQDSITLNRSSQQARHEFLNFPLLYNDWKK